jgi:hypothetical protein
VFSNVLQEPKDIEDTVGPRGLEFGAAGKYYGRLDSLWWQEVQKTANSTHVQLILKDWVLKLELALEEDLGPGRLRRVRENPTLVILSFDYEYTEAGNQDVIDLRCSVVEWQCDVIHQVVFRSAEGACHRARYDGFTAVLEEMRAKASEGEPNGECY